MLRWQPQPCIRLVMTRNCPNSGRPEGFLPLSRTGIRLLQAREPHLTAELRRRAPEIGVTLALAELPPIPTVTMIGLERPDRSTCLP